MLRPDVPRRLAIPVIDPDIARSRRFIVGGRVPLYHGIPHARTHRWLAAYTGTQSRLYLARAVQYFGADRDLASITVSDVRGWATHLQGQPCRGHRMSGGTVRHHLNALSNLYRRAQGEGYVLPGYNPVGALMESQALSGERLAGSKSITRPSCWRRLGRSRSGAPISPSRFCTRSWPRSYSLAGGARKCSASK